MQGSVKDFRGIIERKLSRTYLGFTVTDEIKEKFKEKFIPSP